MAERYTRGILVADGALHSWNTGCGWNWIFGQHWLRVELDFWATLVAGGTGFLGNTDCGWNRIFGQH